MAANKRISALKLFLAFQEIYSGCCTVAAQGWDNHGGASVLPRSTTIPNVHCCLLSAKGASRIHLARQRMFIHSYNVWWRSSSVDDYHRRVADS
jgi:hypothetical protein